MYVYTLYMTFIWYNKNKKACQDIKTIFYLYYKTNYLIFCVKKL